MKRKGFTLVELLVVISVIALLMAILMPALARVRAIAFRLVCGTNLSGIGKAMLIYSNDNEDQYPKAAYTNFHWSTTGTVKDWDGATAKLAYGPMPMTITANFYLLVKYADVMPKQFVCKGDTGTRIFKLSDTTGLVQGTELTDVWDFGGGLGSSKNYSKPGEYCSYTYQMPYISPTGRSYPISAVSSSGSPLCSDRNPYLDKNANGTPPGTGYLDGKDGEGDRPIWFGDPPQYTDKDKTGNSASHGREGQNVMYQDTHVSFEKLPNVGIDKDNIWKYWSRQPPPALSDMEKQLESTEPAGVGTGGPMAEEDAYLVCEDNWP